MKNSAPIGDCVKKLRQASGLTSEKLATKSGVSRATISKLESGQAVRFGSYVKILEALKTPNMSLVQDALVREYEDLLGLGPKLGETDLSSSENNSGMVLDEEIRTIVETTNLRLDVLSQAPLSSFERLPPASLSHLSNLLLATNGRILDFWRKLEAEEEARRRRLDARE